MILRDDDTSFFSSPALLEKIYSRLWEKGLPICLAVIPAQNANVRIMHRPDKRYDPSIPPGYRGQDQSFPVSENTELCAYLNQRAREGLVEIMLHGYAHTYMEFAAEVETVLRQKITDGQAILEKSFPDAQIKTFIGPYDKISKTGIEILLEMGFNICTNSGNFAPFEHLSHLNGYQAHALSEAQSLFTCDEYLFTDKAPPDECLATARRRLQTANPLIVANHYWNFYYDWAGDQLELHRSWNLFLDEVLTDPSWRITTFSAWQAYPGV